MQAQNMNCTCFICICVFLVVTVQYNYSITDLFFWNYSWYLSDYDGFRGGTSGKEPACQCRRCLEMWVQYLGLEDPLEEGMATHSSILAWRIPWTGGARWATIVHRVTKSHTGLKWLSMHAQEIVHLCCILMYFDFFCHLQTISLIIIFHWPF